MRLRDNAGEPGAGLDYIAEADSPDDLIRVWVDGEASPRLTIDPHLGTLTAGDGADPAVPARQTVDRRHPVLIHVDSTFSAQYVATGEDFPAHPITVGGFSDTVIFRNVLDGDDLPTTASCIWIGRGKRDLPASGGLHFDDTDGAAEAFAAVLDAAVSGHGDDGYVRVKIGAGAKVWTRLSPSTARVVSLAIGALTDDALLGWDSQDLATGEPVPWKIDTLTRFVVAVPQEADPA